MTSAKEYGPDVMLFYDGPSPEPGVAAPDAIADSPKVHYDALSELAGQQPSLGPPIDTEAKQLWLRIEEDKPGVVTRFIERVYGEHDSDEVPALWEDQAADSQH